jgi:hypothetical protein
LYDDFFPFTAAAPSSPDSRTPAINAWAVRPA